MASSDDEVLPEFFRGKRNGGSATASPVRVPGTRPVQTGNLPAFFQIQSSDGTAGYREKPEDAAFDAGNRAGDGEDESGALDDETGFTLSEAPNAKAAHDIRNLWKELPPDVVSRIQMDRISLFSVTSAALAEQVSTTMLGLPGISRESTVTDCTSCVGGNVISFARHFHRVNAVELSLKRCEMLVNNVEACRAPGGELPPLTGRVYVYNEDCFRVASRLQQDILFVDPPWGGRVYKKQSAIKLFLGSKSIGEILGVLTRHAKYVVLKHPFNADLSETRAFEQASAPVNLGKFYVSVFKGRDESESSSPLHPVASKLLQTLAGSAAFGQFIEKSASKAR